MDINLGVTSEGQALPDASEVFDSKTDVTPITNRWQKTADAIADIVAGRPIEWHLSQRGNPSEDSWVTGEDSDF